MPRERIVIDEQAANLIATQVTAAIRDELQVLFAASARPEPASGMTVDQVAAWLGVARSTVYTHWREWGGYKLGRGGKAPIRFDAARLPAPPDRVPAEASASRRRAAHPRSRPRRTLIPDAPRFTEPLDELA